MEHEERAVAPDQEPILWWERDEVNLVAAMLDCSSLSAFSSTCQTIQDTLKSKETLRWIAALRGLDASAGLASIEHIQIAEAMCNCASSIFFGWGSMTVDRSAHPSLQAVAKLLARHSTLSLSIDAHCGLEARFAMPHPGQARKFTRERGEAVREALMEQAEAVGAPLDASRVHVRAWGCSRPLYWCFGQPMAEPFDAERAAKNRRVELYLRGRGFEVPKRRLRSEIPTAPGEPPLVDFYEDDNGDDDAYASSPRARQPRPDDDDDDGTADAGAPPDAMMNMELPDGTRMQISMATVLAHLARLHEARAADAFAGEEDYDDDEPDEEAFEHVD